MIYPFEFFVISGNGKTSSGLVLIHAMLSGGAEAD